MQKTILVILLTISTTSNAWVQSGNTKIREIVQWEMSDFALVMLDDNTRCHIPLTEKELYSLALSMYMSGKTLNVHCHDTPENINGYANSHKLHRLNGI